MTQTKGCRIRGILGLALISCCLCACSSNDLKRGEADGADAKHISGQISEGNSPDSSSLIANELSACTVLSDVDSNLEGIRTRSREVLHGKDSCVLAIVDTLISLVHTRGSVSYIVCIDSICANADGYVAEYLDDVGKRLYYGDLPLLLNYLTNGVNRQRSALCSTIISSLNVEIDMSTNPSGTLAKIKKNAARVEAGAKLNPDMQKMLHVILDELELKKE